MTSKTNRTSKRNSIIVAVLIALSALLTACDDPTCDVTGKDTALTTCAYNVVKGN